MQNAGGYGSVGDGSHAYWLSFPPILLVRNLRANSLLSGHYHLTFANLNGIAT